MTMAFELNMTILWKTLCCLIFCNTPHHAGGFTLTSPIASDVMLYVTNISASSTCNTCNSVCPTRTAFPSHREPLNAAANGSCSTLSSNSITNGNMNRSSKFLVFDNASDPSCFVVNFTELTTTNSYFSLTFWINSNISGSSHLVTIGNVAMSISGEHLTIGSDNKPGLKKNEWTFISVTYNGALSVFSSAKPIINQNLRPDNLSVLIGPNKALSVGESLKVGDVRWYPDVLTERELKSLSTGTFMPLTPDSECRCPPKQPFIDNTTVPFNGLRCTNYNKTASISRLNSNAGYPLFVADNYNSTYWSSGSNIDISLTIQLLKLYQMNQIIIVGLNNTSDIEIIELNLVNGVRNTSLKFESNCNGGSCKNIIGHMTGVSFVYSFDESGTTRTEYENLLAQKLVLSIKSKTAKEFQISELIVKARCPCYEQDSACAITNGSYSCNCPNYSGSYCSDCTDGYYRTSNESLTCASCDCMSGSNSTTCVKIGGKCQCKTGVVGQKCGTCKPNSANLGSNNITGCQCLAEFYNITRPDGCTNCSCNLYGSNTKTCDNTTGQCQCYDSVEGQKCDICKDTFYDLSSKCSKSCNCSVAGSVNMVCDKTSGQCSCPSPATQPNRQCIPLISSLTPEFGPSAGGTVVTITGELLNNLNVAPTIFIGEDAQVFINRTSTSIVFVTNKSYNGSRVISIRWSSNEITTKFGAMFEYRPDTNLSVMSNIAAYESGGCHIGFPGTYLDSVKHPRLVVYLDNNNKLESDCSSSGTECSPTGDRVLCCKTPHISSMTTDMTLNFGFKLDGIVNYTNISNFHFVAFKDPVVNRNIETKLSNTFDNGLIEVTGERLNSACNDTDIKITVGEIPCPIESRSDTKITCTINEKFPGKSRTEEIRVTIGNFTQVYGTVEFISFWNTLGFYLILGGVGLLVVIIVVVACCCYRRRKSKSGGESGFLDTESYNRKNRSGNEYVRMTPAAPIQTAPMSEILSSASGTVPVARSVLAPTTSFLSPTPTSNTAAHKVAFCDRLDKPDAKLIESSVVLREHVELSKNPRCTNKGKLARVIDGQFSDSSSRSTVGRSLTIKVLNERYPETGPIPEWLVKELRECTRFRDYYNDHVLRMMGIAIDATKVYILYEEMENRTLKEYMIMSTKDKVIPSVDLMELCLQVAEGMEYISTLAVVHKDLACRNCWVGKDRVVKVADNSFSADLFSKEYMSENGSMVPVRWMAPESLKQGFFDAKSDIWSFGVLMWEVFTDCEYLPFYDIGNDNDVKKKVCFEDYKLVSPESGECVANLMQDCFTTLGKDRPSFRDIINRLLNTISPGANQTQASYVNNKGKGNIGYINKGMTSTDNGEEDYENQGFLKKKKVEDDSEEDYMNTAFGKRH